MKALLTFCLFFFFIPNLPAQPPREHASALKVEWKREFSDLAGGVFSNIVLKEQNLFYAIRLKNGSVFFNQNAHSTSAGAHPVNEFISDIFFRDQVIYTMGGCHLTKRDDHGESTENHCLDLQEYGTLSAVSGKISGPAYYALNWMNTVAAYNLNGEIKWKSDLGEITENKFLAVGGDHLYVLTRITKPDLGLRLIQYDTLGNQKWSVASGNVNNILADQNGNCYAFCLIPQSGNIVSKYNSKGKLLWSKVLPAQTVANGFLYGDTLFTCGIESIDAAAGRLQDPVYSALSATDGKILWQQKFNFYDGDDGYGESFYQVAYDGKALYLGGSTKGPGSKCFLVKLSKEGNTTTLNDATTTRTTLNIFPNPGGSKFTITCEGEQTGTTNVTVRNIAGQVVYQKTLTCNPDKSFTLDMGKQPAGNYTVEMKLGAETVVKKIVVE